MRRTWLLAIGLSALLWTVAAVVDVVSGFSRTSASAAVDVAAGLPVHRSLGEGGSRTSADASALTADTEGPSQSDLKWISQVHTIGVVTESIWKLASVHVDLGATRSPRAVDIGLAASSPDLPAATAPPYLRHTPLLI